MKVQTYIIIFCSGDYLIYARVLKLQYSIFKHHFFVFFKKPSMNKIQLLFNKSSTKSSKKIEIVEKRNLKMAKKRIKIGCSIYRTFVKLSICEIIKLTVVKRFSLSNCFQKNEMTTNNFILNASI